MTRAQLSLRTRVASSRACAGGNLPVHKLRGACRRRQFSSVGFSTEVGTSIGERGFENIVVGICVPHGCKRAWLAVYGCDERAHFHVVGPRTPLGIL